MTLRAATVLAAGLVLLAPSTSQAALSAYSQNFETLIQSDPAALANSGWLVFGNVFTPAHVFIYGYGAFTAPNGGAAFSAIDAGQGGPAQGAQQLSVYSDYNNLDHANGNLIEANVYQEQTISAADVGSIWTFQFDAKLGNLVSPSTALAFIKTINPNAGFAQTNFFTVNTTALPTTWATYSTTITIDGGLVGQLMQFGFSNTASLYAGSGVFYDNLSWLKTGTTDAVGGPRPNAIELRAGAPNPFVSSTRVEYALPEAGDVDISVYDITGRRVATLFHGTAEAGLHVVTWNGRSPDGRTVPTGVYQCVLQTSKHRQSRNLVRYH